ncbi:MAG TPA: hypothetical protein DCZ91_25495 [Lachnospiraceae bacterium]|nr:hypothetical protein [Lachnospiraceae bacterium]
MTGLYKGKGMEGNQNHWAESLMEIRDSSQLKAAYGILNDMQGMKALPGMEEAVQKHIKQLKRDIRIFLRFPTMYKPDPDITSSCTVERWKEVEAMATKEQEKKALEKIREIVDSLGEGSCVGTAMDGVWEVAEQNIDLDTAFSLKEQKIMLEREMEAQVEKAAGLEEVVKKQEEELEILYNDMAEASRLAEKRKMPQEIYRQLINIIEEKMELEARQMEEAADKWADSIGREEEAAWTDLKLQADAFRQHRRQRKAGSSLLLVLAKYGEEEGEEGGSSARYISSV